MKNFYRYDSIIRKVYNINIFPRVSVRWLPIMSNLKKIYDGSTLLGIFIPSDFNKNELSFISDPMFPLQIGFHDRGEIHIEPHYHKNITGINSVHVHEFFYIIEGKILVDLYNEKNEKIAEQIVNRGDSMLIMGGHGIHLLEKTKMLEVKPGPYASKENEKVYLSGIKK